MGMHVQALVDAGVKAKDIAVVAPYNLQVSCPCPGIPLSLHTEHHKTPESCRAKCNQHLGPTPAPLSSLGLWREELLVRCSPHSPQEVWEGGMPLKILLLESFSPMYFL